MSFFISLSYRITNSYLEVGYEHGYNEPVFEQGYWLKRTLDDINYLTNGAGQLMNDADRYGWCKWRIEMVKSVSYTINKKFLTVRDKKKTESNI